MHVDVSKEMKRLVALIRYHNEAYFQHNTSKISDYAYDQLLEQLIALEQAYPHLKVIDSPTEMLGDRHSKNFNAVMHQVEMLSLAKTYTADEILQFITRTQKILNNNPSINFTCEPKIDGIALSLVYEQGNLIRVATRGDGRCGDDITQQAIACLPLPQKIANPPAARFEVRGEAFMPKPAFERLNQLRKAEGEALWANPRNIVAGTLKALDTDFVKARGLGFYAYSFYTKPTCCTTQSEALEWLERLGFETAPGSKVCHDGEEIMAYIDHWRGKRNHFPVAIDGIVIKVNTFTHQQLLGATAKSPRWAIAYKYQPEMAHSILEKVVFQVGRTGAVTPVAHFQPIALAGTMVQRASLYNADEMARLDLHFNDTIFIEKGGDIIPKVVGVDKAQRGQASSPIAFILRCPDCDTPLHRSVGEAIYYCPNRIECPPQRKGALLHFAHRKAMNIDALGPRTIDTLVNMQLVHTAADLYILRYEDLINLEGWHDLSAQRLLANIKHSKHRSFDKVLFALGIKYIGETIARKLALHFITIEKLLTATDMELLALPDIGEKVVQSIRAYQVDPLQQEILRKLQEAGLQFALHQQEPMDGSTIKLPLAAKKLVISGTFQQYTRTTLAARIEEAGGTLLSAISAQVDYLVAGEKAGPLKLAKAVELDIPILREEQIINIIQL